MSMPHISQEGLLTVICCPRCKSALDKAVEAMRCQNASCHYHQQGFPIVQGQPVLIDFEASVVSSQSFVDSGGQSMVARSASEGGVGARIRRALMGTNQAALRCGQQLAGMLGDLSKQQERGSADVHLLVIGGGRQSEPIKVLDHAGVATIITSDIYLSDNTAFAADGHHLPLADSSMDAVWIEAVLEHVLDPAIVVSEIERVLRPGGLVFADTPFMQQVHEGAYDFTRFSVSGHRWLFRNFEALSYGHSAGAGTALAWSLRYFATAVTGSAQVGRLAGLALSWLRLFDRVGSQQKHADAACGVYFLGKLSHQAAVSPKDVERIYANS